MQRSGRYLLVYIAALPLFLAGCAAANRNLVFDEANVRQIVVLGKTTKLDLVSRFGEPSMRTSMSSYASQLASQGGYLGVYVYPNAPVVAQVVSGSPAEKVGILPGDTISEINGTRIVLPQDIALEVRKQQPGDTITVGVMSANGRVVTRPVLEISPFAEVSDIWVYSKFSMDATYGSTALGLLGAFVPGVAGAAISTAGAVGSMSTSSKYSSVIFYLDKNGVVLSYSVTVMNQ
jgi:membrane-associated protease RseP (regulator of RpoE activity)